jgi:hypothetical protein
MSLKKMYSQVVIRPPLAAVTVCARRASWPERGSDLKDLEAREVPQQGRKARGESRNRYSPVLSEQSVVLGFVAGPAGLEVRRAVLRWTLTVEGR